MAELLPMGFSPWDRPSKSSGGTGKATKKTPTRVIHPAKRKIKRREVAELVGKWRAAGSGSVEGDDAMRARGLMKEMGLMSEENGFEMARGVERGSMRMKDEMG